MLCNNLKLYSDKTEMPVIGTRQQHAKVQDLSIKIHALVVSRLDSTNSLLYSLPAAELKKLQKIQNSAARTLTGASKSSIEAAVLAAPSVLEYKILMLDFKCSHGFAPYYLETLLAKYEPARMTRSASDGYPLKSNSKKLKTARDRSFSHAVPTLWNKLPY